MGRDVTVEFTVVDGRSVRGEFASRQELKKVIQKSLADYNWRLMSEGISYRMGFVTGRLKGIEHEEELAKDLVKTTNHNS